MFKERINQLFMSREQTIYLLFLFVDCVVYGSFAATFTYYQIGLGTRFYSLIVSTGCIVGVYGILYLLKCQVYDSGNGVYGSLADYVYFYDCGRVPPEAL